MTISPAFLAGTVTAKPPPILGDAQWANVAALLPFDGSDGATTFTDAKGVVTWARTGTPALTTSQKKWGTASLSLPGGTNYLQSSAGILLGSGQFTLDGWFRCTSTASVTQTIMGNYNAASGDWTLVLTTAGRLEFYESTGNTDLYSTNGVDLRDSAWHFFTIARNAANRVTLSVDGSEKDGLNGVTTNINNTGAIRIGHNNFLDGFTGQVDDLRITVGVARANTVPTKAFPTLG